MTLSCIYTQVRTIYQESIIYVYIVHRYIYYICCVRMSHFTQLFFVKHIPERNPFPLLLCQPPYLSLGSQRESAIYNIYTHITFGIFSKQCQPICSSSSCLKSERENLQHVKRTKVHSHPNIHTHSTKHFVIQSSLIGFCFL